MKNRLILFFSLLSSFGLFSQENSLSFSLQEAIDYALEHNRTVQNAALDIEAAKKQKWETTSTGLPQINASIDYNNWLKQQISLIPAEFFGGNPGEYAEVIFTTKQSLTATATLSQKIFDGSYLVGLQSAKVYLEISKNAKEKTDLEIRQAVINAYGNVLLAEESIGILKRNIEVLQKNLDEITKIYENGLEEEESVEQLQITLSSVQSNLNNTQRLKNIAYQMLNITLGIDVQNKITLTDSLESLASENITLNIFESENAVENNIDYKIATNNIRSNELLLKLEKSKALPTLNAFVNGSYNGYGEQFDFLKKEQDWYGASLFGVSMNIPIFSSLGRSAATQKAKINLEKAKNDFENTKQQLKLEISQAKSNYLFSIEEYENKKQNLALAERIEQKNQTKFFEGISSSFDLRQAQTQLYASQQEFLQAMLDLINNKAELDKVLNTPLNHK
ncbi:TolC family protein [Seonamhaeicola sp. NFXS20]|uniref:TolC family protein n=1 Tax=unclassified Seonamhaeicola TaxID=2622645 RepID=UPI00356845D7